MTGLNLTLGIVIVLPFLIHLVRLSPSCVVRIQGKPQNPASFDKKQQIRSRVLPIPTAFLHAEIRPATINENNLPILRSSSAMNSPQDF
jgi:hypothetical protein